MVIDGYSVTFYENNEVLAKADTPLKTAIRKSIKFLKNKLGIDVQGDSIYVGLYGEYINEECTKED